MRYTPYRTSRSLLILTICFFAFVRPSLAGVKLGVKTGASFATEDASGDVLPGINSTMRTGFTAGGIVEFPLSPVLYLRVEPMYVQKGSEVDWPSEFDEHDNTHKLDYLLLPVNLKVRIDSESISPFLFAGVHVGYVISNEVVLKNSGGSFEGSNEDWDFGLDIGAGTDVPMKDSLWLTFDARFFLGLADISTAPSDTSVKNRGLIVQAGILLEL